MKKKPVAAQKKKTDSKKQEQKKDDVKSDSSGIKKIEPQKNLEILAKQAEPVALDLAKIIREETKDDNKEKEEKELKLEDILPDYEKPVEKNEEPDNPYKLQTDESARNAYHQPVAKNYGPNTKSDESQDKNYKPSQEQRPEDAYQPKSINLNYDKNDDHDPLKDINDKYKK